MAEGIAARVVSRLAAGDPSRILGGRQAILGHVALRERPAAALEVQIPAGGEWLPASGVLSLDRWLVTGDHGRVRGSGQLRLAASNPATPTPAAAALRVAG